MQQVQNVCRMNILLADKQQLFKEGVKLILGQFRQNIHTVEANDYPGVLDLLSHHECFDLALVELELPGNDDLFGIQKIRQLTPATPIIVMSASNNARKINRALSIGVKGFIAKNETAADLVQAVEMVSEGRTYSKTIGSNKVETEVDISANKSQSQDNKKAHPFGLTERQEQILSVLCSGATNKEIASRLTMTEATVRKHLTTIFKKINVVNRSQAVRLYIELHR